MKLSGGRSEMLTIAHRPLFGDGGGEGEEGEGEERGRRGGKGGRITFI